jgi:hypothetical protein
MFPSLNRWETSSNLVGILWVGSHFTLKNEETMNLNIKQRVQRSVVVSYNLSPYSVCLFTSNEDDYG